MEKIVTNKKSIIVCGDSFNYGIGCTNLHTKPYGVLTAKHFNWDLVRLARGSASNFTIYLQGAYAATMTPKPHLIILGTTSCDRIEWIATGKTEDTNIPLTALDINYDLYPPHYHTPPLHDAPMDFHFKNNPNYAPKILSEQVIAFSEYLKLAKANNKTDYYKRLHTESIEKVELMENYYFDIFDSRIKTDYDRGVILMAYKMIKKQGINCIIFSSDSNFKDLVDDPRDYYNQDWGRCTRLWPDTVNSMHTGDGGHQDTAERLIEHIEMNGFL
jgi:hypothetical protein